MKVFIELWNFRDFIEFSLNRSYDYYIEVALILKLEDKKKFIFLFS